MSICISIRMYAASWELSIEARALNRTKMAHLVSAAIYSNQQTETCPESREKKEWH